MAAVADKLGDAVLIGVARVCPAAGIGPVVVGEHAAVGRGVVLHMEHGGRGQGGAAGAVEAGLDAPAVKLDRRAAHGEGVPLQGLQLQRAVHGHELAQGVDVPVRGDELPDQGIGVVGVGDEPAMPADRDGLAGGVLGDGHGQGVLGGGRRGVENRRGVHVGLCLDPRPVQGDRPLLLAGKGVDRGVEVGVHLNLAAVCVVVAHARIALGVKRLILGGQQPELKAAVIEGEAVLPGVGAGHAVAHEVLAEIGVAPGRRVVIPGEHVHNDVRPGLALAGVVRADDQAREAGVDLPAVHIGKQAGALLGGGDHLEPAVMVKVRDGVEPVVIGRLLLVPDVAAALDQVSLLGIGHGGRRGRGRRDHGRRGRYAHGLGLFSAAGAQQRAAQQEQGRERQSCFFHVCFLP